MYLLYIFIYGSVHTLLDNTIDSKLLEINKNYSGGHCKTPRDIYGADTCQKNDLAGLLQKKKKKHIFFYRN